MRWSIKFSEFKHLLICCGEIGADHARIVEIDPFLNNDITINIADGIINIYESQVNEHILFL